MTGCLQPESPSNANATSILVTGLFVNNGTKTLHVWLNVTPEKETGKSFDQQVDGGEALQIDLRLTRNGTQEFGVAWTAAGERIGTDGAPLAEDGFRYRENRTFNLAQCPPDDIFRINSTARYVRSENDLLAPFQYHGIEGDTRFNGCGHNDM